MMLLERLKARGVVEWHVWQNVCPNKYVIDSQLGVDHFGELADGYGKVFFMINTKATEDALRKHQKKCGRENVLGFRPHCSIANPSEDELLKEEGHLLTEILMFFGDRCVSGKVTTHAVIASEAKQSRMFQQIDGIATASVGNRRLAMTLYFKVFSEV